MGVLATSIGAEIVLRTWKHKPRERIESESVTGRCEAPGTGKPRWEFSTLRTLRLQTDGMSAATRMPRVTSLKFVG